jgi:hypothetical protein
MSTHSRRVIECLPEQPQRYRYRLHVALGEGPALTVVLKNPSHADAVRRDPTVGKVEAWARRRGFGSVVYVNLFAYRSPEPRTLNRLPYEVAVGPDNDATLLAAGMAAALLVAAWGNPNGIEPHRYARRVAEVTALLSQAATPAWCVVGGWTRLGYPRHGLHWNGEAALLPWPTPPPAYRSS